MSEDDKVAALKMLNSTPKGPRKSILTGETEGTSFLKSLVKTPVKKYVRVLDPASMTPVVTPAPKKTKGGYKMFENRGSLEEINKEIQKMKAGPGSGDSDLYVKEAPELQMALKNMVISSKKKPKASAAPSVPKAKKPEKPKPAGKVSVTDRKVLEKMAFIEEAKRYRKECMKLNKEITKACAKKK